MDNKAMVALLEDTLARAKTGAIPYSARAIGVLEREIAARKAVAATTTEG